MTKVLHSCLLVLFIGSSLSGFSQEKNQSVIASAGDISKGGNVTLEWTLGELAVEKAVGNEKIYTQGFHQPIVITKLKPSIETVSGYKVNIYPNPVPSILNIYIQSVIDSKVYLKLLDVKGRLLYSNSTYSMGSSVKIDMRAFASGVYFLTVIGPSGVTIGTYKIVKAS